MTYGFYTPHIYAAEEKESLLKASAASAVAEGSYAERIPSEDKDALWIRTFLISHDMNKRGWSISRQTSLKNVYTAVGAPLLLAQNASGNLDHPYYDVHKNASENAAEHQKYKIGTIERVYYSKDKDAYYADCKITDPAAKQYIRKFNGSKIPLKVSPQVIFDKRFEPENGPYKSWHLSHLAVVSNNAYNGAQMVAMCNGDGQTCKEQLQKSSVAAATAAASASASAMGLTLQRDTSSSEAFLSGRTIWAPPSGKRPGRLA